MRPRYLRSDQRTRSLHYFNAYAVKDHIDFSGLSNHRPSCTLRLDPAVILPCEDDLAQITHTGAVLLSCVLAKYLTIFSVLSDDVCRRIQHVHSAAMKQKSVVVS